jgi:Lecithin retinol acyltransferase
MLEVHPKADSYEYFSSLITSPYVERKEVGNVNFNHYIFFANGSGTVPSNLDRYFKPLDIAKVREIHKISGITYYHFGIYLGDVGDGRKICHFTRENNGVRLTNWDGFLKDRIGELYRYHPTIPFKYPRRIAEQIAWAYSNNFRENQYDLRNRNCEHFANMCVYGVNFSEQVDDKKGQLIVKASIQSAGIGAYGGTVTGASIVLAPFTFGLSLIPGAVAATATVAGIVDNAEKHCTLNNNKGSTIKLVNEMSESNGKLGEKDN